MEITKTENNRNYNPYKKLNLTTQQFGIDVFFFYKDNLIKIVKDNKLHSCDYQTAYIDFKNQEEGERIFKQLEKDLKVFRVKIFESVLTKTKIIKH
jgi:hypothetical protein